MIVLEGGRIDSAALRACKEISSDFPRVESGQNSEVILLQLPRPSCVSTDSASIADATTPPPTSTPIPPTLTPSVTVEDLIGVWLATKTGMDYVQFNADGTYRHAKAIPWLEMAPVEQGQFRLEGTTLTFISGNDSQECRGQSGSYQVD